MAIILSRKSGIGGSSALAGHEIGYVETAGDVTVTAGNAAAAQTVLTLPAHTYNGQTTIMIQFYACTVWSETSQNVIFNLWDGATDLGRICTLEIVGGSNLTFSANGFWRITPSAGSHTYIAKVWADGSDGTIFNDQAPCFLRATVA